MKIARQGARLTRRQFVASSAAGTVVAAVGCKSLGNSAWEFLSASQAKTLGAICDQIIPPDDYPGATEAGVLNYIDKQLVRHYKRHREAYRQGLEAAQTLSRRLTGRDLDEAAAPQQFQVVSALADQDPQFFSLVKDHTMQGYYGSPRHGGNIDAQSWRMLGVPEPPVRGRAQYDLRKGAQQ